MALAERKEHKFQAVTPSGLIRRCVFCDAKELAVNRGKASAECPGRREVCDA